MRLSPISSRLLYLEVQGASNRPINVGIRNLQNPSASFPRLFPNSTLWRKGGSLGKSLGSLHVSLHGSTHETVPVLFGVFVGIIFELKYTSGLVMTTPDREVDSKVPRTSK